MFIILEFLELANVLIQNNKKKKKKRLILKNFLIVCIEQSTGIWDTYTKNVALIW